MHLRHRQDAVVAILASTPDNATHWSRSLVGNVGARVEHFRYAPNVPELLHSGSKVIEEADLGRGGRPDLRL